MMPPLNQHNTIVLLLAVLVGLLIGYVGMEIMGLSALAVGAMGLVAGLPIGYFGVDWGTHD